MTKESLITTVSQTLENFFEEHSSQGMLALYIWGSVLTPDFNSETSDIDTIAIVEDRFDFQNEARIQRKLSECHPEIKKVGFRLLYKSELDTGKIKGYLGGVIAPSLLLLDFPTWHWVCGTKFNQADFALPVPTVDQALTLRCARFKEQNWNNIDAIPSEDVQYFIKQILRVIHLEQWKREGSTYRLFSYDALKRNVVPGLETDVVGACLKIRDAHWDVEEFKKHRQVINAYMATFFQGAPIG